MTIKSVSVTDARANLSELIGRAQYGNEPTVITHHDKPVAVLVPYWPPDDLAQRVKKWGDAYDADTAERFTHTEARKAYDVALADVMEVKAEAEAQLHEASHGYYLAKESITGPE